jgi:ribonuclease HII
LEALPDKNLWTKYNFIAGCDEAGRGPLAGPVIAAAVILPRNFFHPAINDSKKLSPAQRAKTYPIITAAAVAYAFGIVDHLVIDEINILNATKRAMREAIRGLSVSPEAVLIDAVKLDDLGCEQISLIRGDTLSISIAAASILAKVRRDGIMVEFGKMYPLYQFHRHKGYPTALHRACIKKFGPCPIHRKSFRLLSSE